MWRPERNRGPRSPVASGGSGSATAATWSRGSDRQLDRIRQQLRHAALPCCKSASVRRAEWQTSVPDRGRRGDYRYRSGSHKKVSLAREVQRCREAHRADARGHDGRGIQPPILSDIPIVNSPMMRNCAAIHIITASTGAATIPGPRSSRALGSGRGRRRWRRRWPAWRPRPWRRMPSPEGTAGDAHGPLSGLANGIRGGASQHRYGGQPGADDPDREVRAGEGAGDRAERLCRLGGGLDLRHAVGMKRRSRGDGDRESDEVGDRHADIGIEPDALEAPGTCSGASDQSLRKAFTG